MVDFKNEFYKERLIDYRASKARDSRLQSVETIRSAIGYICLIALSVGFVCVLFGNPFDSEEFFHTLISADYAPFSLDDFITGAHNLLPDDVGIFDGIENLFIAIGCIGYSLGFLINLIFALFFA